MLSFYKCHVCVCVCLCVCLQCSLSLNDLPINSFSRFCKFVFCTWLIWRHSGALDSRSRTWSHPLRHMTSGRIEEGCSLSADSAVSSLLPTGLWEQILVEVMFCQFCSNLSETERFVREYLTSFKVEMQAQQNPRPVQLSLFFKMWLYQTWDLKFVF